MKSNTRASGFSLIELMITVAISAILLAVAVPGVSDMVSHTRLKGAAQGGLALMRSLHAESVKRGRPLYLTWKAPAGGADWCYGVSDVGSCDCHVANDCTVDGVVRIGTGVDYPGISMSATSSGEFSFKPKRMTVTSGSVTFTAPSGKQLKVSANGISRIRICSPSGAANLGGYPLCA